MAVIYFAVSKKGGKKPLKGISSFCVLLKNWKKFPPSHGAEFKKTTVANLDFEKGLFKQTLQHKGNLARVKDEALSQDDLN